MESNIYDQFDAAFARVSAFAVMEDSKLVAKVAIKFPADGAGRLYAYVHWIGIGMVRGFAGGYGYDKRSAAVAVAALKIANDAETLKEAAKYRQHDSLPAFLRATGANDGQDWTRALERASFTVWQVV